MIDRCKTCGGPIRWALTDKNRRLPLDPDPVPGGNCRLSVESAPFGMVERVAVVTPRPDEIGYVPHFSTCPQAASHRKNRSRA